MSVKVYDLDSVSVVFGAVPLKGGSGEGGFISIEPAGPDFKTKVGADGTVTRSKVGPKGNRLFMVKIKLMQSSPINALLAALNLTDCEASGGAGIVPLAIADLQGLSLFSTAESWIEGKPTQLYNQEAGDVEWTIVAVDPLTSFVGGN